VTGHLGIYSSRRVPAAKKHTGTTGTHHMPLRMTTDMPLRLIAC
jgi:hypothetical protein